MALVPDIDIDDSNGSVQSRRDLLQQEPVALDFHSSSIPIHTLEELQLTIDGILINAGERLAGMKKVVSGDFGKCLLRSVSSKDLVLLSERSFESLSITQKQEATYDLRNRERELERSSELLHHQHVLRISAFISPDRHPDSVIGILTEYAPNVEEFFANDPDLDEDDLWRWAYQLAMSMAYIVRRYSILHRAIRPENVFVFNGGALIKLGNFYFARTAHPTSLYSETKQDPAYCAPETLGKKDVLKYTFSSDVYSYAMFLYYITHRRHPFAGETTGNSVNFRKRLEGNIRPRPVLSTEHPDFHQLINVCWRTELRDEGGNVKEGEPLRYTFAQVTDYIVNYHPDSLQ